MSSESTGFDRCREFTDRDLSLKLPPTRQGHALPRPYYTSPDIFEAEWSTLFLRRWLFAGHSCEVPKTGDYLTFEFGPYSVLVIRQEDGSLWAVHNTCRHRGSRLCSVPHGTFAKRIVCPYHQWTYRLDGKLNHARHFDELAKTEYGLKPVSCKEVEGYIFVCLSNTPPDFKPIREQMSPYLGPHRLEDARVAFENTIVEAANWKLVLENNRECYHCVANHPELCRTFPEAPTLVSAEADPHLAQHWTRCEAAGFPSKFQLSAAGDLRTMRLPLLNKQQSLTMSGAPAVRRNLGDVADQDLGSLLILLYPTMWNHILPDHAITFQVTPLDGAHTQIRTKWLVHRDAKEGMDYSLKELTEVWMATNDQDRRIVEENQRGVNSPIYEPGPYAPQHEAGVRQFQEWYRRVFIDEVRSAGEAQAVSFR